MRTATRTRDGAFPTILSSRLACIAITGGLWGSILFSPAAAQEPLVTEAPPIPDPDLPDSDLEEPAAPRTLPQEIRAIPGVKPGMDVRELVEVAESALDTRQLDDAETILRYLVRQHPDLLPAQSLLAYACELQMEAFSDPQTGSPAKAESYQTEAVRHYLRAGNLALEQGRYAPAKGLFDRIRRYEPTNPEMKLGLARYHAATERYMLAIEQYNEYIKTSPGRKDSQAWLELGRIFHHSGYKGQAVTTLQKALGLNPDNPEIHYELAVTYLDDERIAQAREVARTAMQKGAANPNYHKYVNLYARVLFASNRYDEATAQAVKAIGLAREGLAREPDNVNLLHAVIGYHETLEAILKTKIGAMPDETGFRIDLARSIADRSDASRLMGFHAALSVLPLREAESRSNIELLELAAELQLAVRRHADAAETCKRLLELDSDNAAAKQILQRLPAELRSTAATESDGSKETAAASP